LGWSALDLANSIMTSLLTKLADELLVQDITEPSAVLGSLSGHELEAAYDHVLETSLRWSF